MPSDYNDTGIATGAIANIQNGADAVPLSSWLIDVNPTLSGVSSVVCTQAGKNLLPNKTYQRNATTLRIGTDTLDGTLTFPAGTYTLSVKTALTGATLNYTSGGSTTSISTSTDGDYRKGTFTLSKKTELFFGCYNSGGITSAQVSELQLEVGNSRTAYNAYNSTTHTVSLGRTIYGGSVDVVNGTGTDTHAKMTFTGAADETWYWSESGGNYRVYASLANAKTDTNTFVSNLITPAPSASGYPAIGTGWINNNGRIVIGVDSSITSVSDWKTYLSNNNMEIAYELADEYKTALTFTPITPTPETALGVNNFYGDTGDSEVTYYKSGYGYTSVTVNQKDSSDTLIDTKTIKLHRLIYEGSVDVIRGIGSDAYKEMTIKEMGFSRTGDYFQVSRSSVGAGELTNDNIFCTCYQRGSSSGDKVFWYTDSYIRFRDSDYTTVEAMESAVGNESFRFLASTPTAFTFPPVSFNTIEGEQFLFASEGNSAITYRKGVE